MIDKHRYKNINGVIKGVETHSLILL